MISSRRVLILGTTVFLEKIIKVVFCYITTIPVTESERGGGGY